MRNEEEMFQLIINTAKKDDRIRAAYLEGSRANPEVKKDRFQDYDIVYIVEETTSFIKDISWIDIFGERLFMQYPDEFSDSTTDKSQCYGWLIQFTDGNRLDLHVCTLDYALKHLEIYQVLLDKDNILPSPPHNMQSIYWVKKPSKKEFLETCNEFWWCLNNIGKGIKRDEIPYVLEILDSILRPMYKKMLIWYIGIHNDFHVNAGKGGKYLKQYLPEEMYNQFMSSYYFHDTDSLWQLFFNLCINFDHLAKSIANNLSYSYNQEEANNSFQFLKDIYDLT